jgi:putative hydrolase of the HAD superfamily
MRAATSDPDPPVTVVAVGGLVASGKSTIAKALADHMAVPRIVADQVRDELLQGAPGPAVHETHWEESFGPGFQARVYAELLRRAESVLDSGRTVVLDACFPTVRDRTAARALALRRGLPFCFVECHADGKTQRVRLAERDGPSPDGGWDKIARALASRWEPPDELPEAQHVRLDTARSPAECITELLARLPGRSDRTRPPVSALPRDPAAVTFDCWRTLIYEADWTLAHARRVDALARAAEEAGRPTSTKEAGTALDVAWETHMTAWRDGIVTGAHEVAEHALRLIGLREPHPALEHLVREYEEASHSGRVLAIDGAVETLEALSVAGVRRALVCDTGLTPGRVVRRHLERQGLLEHLEVCVFSDEIGVPKPDPRVFRAALEPLGVPPVRAVHVGDLRRTDVAGARTLGMGTVRIRAQYDDVTDLPEADAVADSHGEVLAILGLRPG